MPCDISESERLDYANAEARAATKAACAALKELDSRRIKIPKEARDWWDDHKEQDARREQEEREEALRKELYQKAASKLTKKERKILGLR